MNEKRHRKDNISYKEGRKSSKNVFHSCSSSSNSSDTEKWIEKPSTSNKRDDWMSMTGVLKTFTKDDIKPKLDCEKRKNIDSYNPATSSRELNPFWKDGGSGVPLSSEKFYKSRPFIKPKDDDYGFYKSSSSKEIVKTDKEHKREIDTRKSNWRSSNTKSKECKESNIVEGYIIEEDKTPKLQQINSTDIIQVKKQNSELKKSLNLSQMNKLAAKIVKAEIMGDIKLVEELKGKLEAAREYRKQNPDDQEEEDDRVMLLSTSSTGSSRPLTQNKELNSQNKHGKRKAETHDVSGRIKYFGNDDKYNLAQMFQEEKYGSNYDNEAQLAHVMGKKKNPNDDLEDIFLDEISKNNNSCKDDEKMKQHAINQNVKLEKSLDGCEHCIDSKNMLKHLIISCGPNVYVALPARKSLVKGHCIITTIQHSMCVTALDEDIWEEILNYRKMITQFFNAKNHDVVFYETATKLNRYPHMVINCVPLPRDVGDMASIYFKKGLLECEAEWSMNKKVVDLKGKNIRKGVPKGLPYFWVDFGMEAGFAHVIEDQQLFPRNFAEEIIGGMLDLDHSLWKKPQRELADAQRKKVLEFVNEWKPFEKHFKGK